MRAGLYLLLFLLLPFVAAAFELEPLHTRNLAPPALIQGIPTLQPARVLKPGEWQWAFNLDAVSNFTFRGADGSSTRLDGETWCTELALKTGLANGFEVGLALPYLRHTGGFLDGFIENWHDLFGLPQGGRDTAARDRLNYSYSDAAGRSFTRTSAADGIGDIALEAGWQWFQTPNGGSLAVRGRLKLPTGSSSRLTGSGAWDTALWLSGEMRRETRFGPLALYGGTGLLLTGTGEVLPELRRRLAGTVSAGIGLQPFSRLGLQLQFDGHTPLYRGTGLREFDRFAGQLAMGGQVALGERTALELAVVEDILVDTAPDVVFHLGLRQRF
ncbi:MAG: DUF3187 family protein [Geothermobacteraceae bacterium]